MFSYAAEERSWAHSGLFQIVVEFWPSRAALWENFDNTGDAFVSKFCN